MCWATPVRLITLCHTYRKNTNEVSDAAMQYGKHRLLVPPVNASTASRKHLTIAYTNKHDCRPDSALLARVRRQAGGGEAHGSEGSYLLASMPEGGVHSVFFLPISFQLVDSTVPLDSCMQGQVPLLICVQGSVVVQTRVQLWCMVYQCAGDFVCVSIAAAVLHSSKKTSSRVVSF